MDTRQSRQMTNRQIGYRNSYYIEGNTVRVTDPVRELQQPPKRVNHAVRRNREKARYMNLPYVMFLTAALVMTALMLIGYIRVQAGLTVSIERVAKLERQLNDMRLNNDEQLERINSAIDMAEVKRIAVEELGMTYAKEGQVVRVSKEGSDYVRELVYMPQ